MRRYAAVVAAVPLLLTACGGGGALVAAPPSSSATPTTDAQSASATSATSTTTTTSATSSSASQPPPAPPSANVQDCFDGDCTLLLTGPATIPLDAATFYYPSMQVTAISAGSLSYSVAFPHGGGAQSTVGVGLGGGGFGFRDFQGIKVGLTLVDGAPALVLQAGPL